MGPEASTLVDFCDDWLGSANDTLGIPPAIQARPFLSERWQELQAMENQLGVNIHQSIRTFLQSQKKDLVNYTHQMIPSKCMSLLRTPDLDSLKRLAKHDLLPNIHDQKNAQYLSRKIKDKHYKTATHTFCIEVADLLHVARQKQHEAARIMTHWTASPHQAVASDWVAYGFLLNNLEAARTPTIGTIADEQPTPKPVSDVRKYLEPILKETDPAEYLVFTRTAQPDTRDRQPEPKSQPGRQADEISSENQPPPTATSTENPPQFFYAGFTQSDQPLRPSSDEPPASDDEPLVSDEPTISDNDSDNSQKPPALAPEKPPASGGPAGLNQQLPAHAPHVDHLSDMPPSSQLSGTSSDEPSPGKPSSSEPSSEKASSEKASSEETSSEEASPEEASPEEDSDPPAGKPAGGLHSSIVLSSPKEGPAGSAADHGVEHADAEDSVADAQQSVAGQDETPPA
ncbi:hypothetical protein GNI_039710 [Gregarina niphandrodes]|uniref:Uncharacterized protein n=1 Tax=Gregarina niphandrodes TaxID=110365 RepID=A0A023BAH0_GRENI|nr:hypothetical protein GNI_039710 [Gregarina niphandrodes]EZG78211.1 hypothetical protein GNI_039710 [Gregarina niphandrodes]|eukprot:XP_011129400.1 hypothetical protein GNI_039710 [Gregarina niphandrodes]